MLTIKVAKSDLDDALQVTSGSLSSSGSDISTHFLFRANPTGDAKKQAEILTCSHRLFSSCPFVCTLEKEDGDPEAFTIEGARLKEWLGSLGDVSITFEFDGASIKASVPRGYQTFQSLDPSTFPYWDDTLKKVEETSKIAADRLHAALSYIQPFISDNEAKRPDLCVCEVRDEYLIGTTGRAASFLKIKGLETSTLRLHRQAVPKVLSFLATIKEHPVTVLEHKRLVVFRRDDGAVFGEGRFQDALPKLKPPQGEDHHVWELPRVDVLSGIPFLRSGASKEDLTVRFSRATATGPVQMSMRNTSGRETTLDIPCTTSESTKDATAIPDDGLTLSCDALESVLKASLFEDRIPFGITIKSDTSGYIRFTEQRNDDEYMTVLLIR